MLIVTHAHTHKRKVVKTIKWKTKTTATVVVGDMHPSTVYK